MAHIVPFKAVRPSKKHLQYFSSKSYKNYTEEELQKRRQNWTSPKLKFDRGVLYKYARTVSSASKGCVTDEF